jgi:hypothetical protein
MSETETNHSEEIQELKERVEVLEHRLMNLERGPRTLKPAVIDHAATIRSAPTSNMPARPARMRSNDSGPTISTSKPEPGPTITHEE